MRYGGRTQTQGSLHLPHHFPPHPVHQGTHIRYVIRSIVIFVFNIKTGPIKDGIFQQQKGIVQFGESKQNGAHIHIELPWRFCAQDSTAKNQTRKKDLTQDFGSGSVLSQSKTSRFNSRK